MDKKIAILFEGRTDQRAGVFRAVVNRAKHLQQAMPECRVSTIMIQVYDSQLAKIARHTAPIPSKPTHIQDDGVDIEVWWLKRSIFDSISHRALGIEPPVLRVRMRCLAKRLRSFDLISAHDFIAATVASYAGTRYKLPWTATWHGSSIHTDPMRDEPTMLTTARLLKTANMNFMVSHDLELKARELITPEFPAQVLYNGANPAFRRFSDAERLALRDKYGVASGTKVVAWVGRYSPVKNAKSLPDIFAAIKSRYSGNLQFWTIGYGEEHDQVQKLIADKGIHVDDFGRVEAVEMPSIMNCVDVLVLPSLNEGMPLVAIEALQCGANVAGSDVGGIKEVVGEENVIPICADFTQQIAYLVATMLSEHVEQPLPPQCSWKETAQAESNVYRELMNLK